MQMSVGPFQLIPAQTWGPSLGVWLGALDRVAHLFYGNRIACVIAAEQLSHQSKQHHENCREGAAEPIPNSSVGLPLE